jgi:hypothetical protein
LVLSALVPGGCSSSANDAGPRATGGASGAGGWIDTAGSAGEADLVIGGSSATIGGDASAGDDGVSGGGSSPQGGMTGSGPPRVSDKCDTDSDCGQVPGSCFVCEAAGAAKDCIDKGAPSCDNGTVEPCEVCELGDSKSCLELGVPGQFSGGAARCLATCDGWDTSGCSVCGNGQRQAGEDCDGTDPPDPHTCADEGLADNPDTALPCTAACHFDTTLCGGCSKNAANCLDDSDCSAEDCNDAECKASTSCELDCSGADTLCRNTRCNHGASCHFVCEKGGRCAGAVCDSGASCKLDCAGGACDDVTCRTGAVCDFGCDGEGSQCSGEASCGSGKTCTFDCSDGGDCHALAVQCLSGATCHFLCASAGSVCPKADCQSESDCTFSCPSGDCNEPTCAEGACSGNEP